MSYDFAVLVNDAPMTVEDAQSRYTALFEGRFEPPPPQVQHFATTLLEAAPMADEADGWLMGEPMLARLGAVVFSSWDDPDANLYKLLTLARPHDLAVLDVQRPRLYDPSGAVAVEVFAGDGTRSPFLSPSLLRVLLDSLSAQHPHVVVERDHDRYVQTRRNSDGTFEIEHRAGSDVEHYRLPAVDARMVELALWQWATDAADWRTLPWEHVAV